MISYNRHTHTFDAMINGVIVASEQSYLAADEAMRAVRQAITKACSTLADLMTPPPPPAAPAAKKPAKRKPKKCPCPSCTPQEVTNGIYFCRTGKEWHAYHNGYIGSFDRALDAQTTINNLNTESLRRAAA